MGMLVAAAGTMAGGFAAKALGADKGKVAPDGGGIEGLTSSKGTGKLGNGPGYAIQVDPTKSLQMYDDAVSQYTNISNSGLNQYLPSLKKAAEQISTGYQSGNTTLQPVAYAGVQALNEQMRMLGMDPLPATSKYTNAIGDSYKILKDNLPGFQDKVDTFQALLNQADKEKDPAKRAQLKTQVTTAFDQFQKDAKAQAESNFTQWGKDHPVPAILVQGAGESVARHLTQYPDFMYEKDAKGNKITMDDYYASHPEEKAIAYSAGTAANPKGVGGESIPVFGGASKMYGDTYMLKKEYSDFFKQWNPSVPEYVSNIPGTPGYDPTMPTKIKPADWYDNAANFGNPYSDSNKMSQYGNANAAQTSQQVNNNDLAAWQKAYDAQRKTTTDFEDKYLGQIGDLGKSWAQDYADTYDAGYTGDQVTEKITSMPGYDFQLNQGVKALSRAAAAKGMLGSANTELGLMDYGQGLGMNYYQQYMTYLQGVSSQGLSANNQIAANQVNEGGSLAALTQQGGLAQWQNAQAIAQAAYNANAAKAELYNRTSMFNAQAQNTSIQNSRAQDASMAQSAIGAAPGIMNAQNNAAVIGANYQNAQAMGAGMNYGAGYGGSFNNYFGTGSANRGGYLSFM